MIPSDRPVCGGDLETLRQVLGLTVSDMIFELGMSMTRWMHLAKRDPGKPLRDQALALLVRELERNPELCITPRYPAMVDLFALMDQGQKSSQKEKGILLGCEASAAYRWLATEQRQSPSVRRLALVLQRKLLAVPEQDRGKTMERWKKEVLTEGQARGVTDVFADGSWTNGPRKPAKKSAKKLASKSVKTKRAGKSVARKPNRIKTAASASA